MKVKGLYFQPAGIGGELAGFSRSDTARPDDDSAQQCQVNPLSQSTKHTYKGLRAEMRSQRGQLSSRAQALAAEGLLSVVTRLPEFQRARRLGIYLARGGEIDPSPIKQLAETAGKACYLPVLHPLKHNRLYFVRHREGETLNSNRFGIGEPGLSTHRIVPAWSLQIIFVPLLAFDEAGNRVGMGGGFYDRSLAFTRSKPGFGPRLIGLAHSFQQVDHLRPSPWDIPLHGIATERGFVSPKKSL